MRKMLASVLKRFWFRVGGILFLLGNFRPAIQGEERKGVILCSVVAALGFPTPT